MKLFRAILGNLVLSSTVLIFNIATAAPTITYFHNDVSGTPLVSTDVNGELLWKENYRPYGDKLNNDPISASNKLGFTGKPYDENIGLSYMGARYYDPAIGRFLAADPKGFDPENIHSFNRYSYANNNPYRFVDPDGHSPIDAIKDWWSASVAGFKSESIGDAAGRVLAGWPVEGVALGALGMMRSVGAEAGLASKAVEGVHGAKALSAAKNGETAATKAGRQAHKDWNPGPGFEKEVRLPSGKRADAVDFEFKHVKELKPDNPRAIREGKKQVEQYRQELANEFGGTWTSSVETYKRFK